MNALVFVDIFTRLHYGWITHPLIYNQVFIIFFAKFWAKYRNASFRINPLRKAGEFGLCLKETNKQKKVKNKVFKEHRKEKDRERDASSWHGAQLFDTKLQHHSCMEKEFFCQFRLCALFKVFDRRLTDNVGRGKSYFWKFLGCIMK